jgi:uncharacterized membrane protein
MLKFKYWKFNKNRLEAFSDGVFAIIITLLILEIKVPHLNNTLDNSELKEKLFDLIPVFLSWLISFLIVGTLWLQHHNILRMAKHIDYGFVWINILFLLSTSFIPFPSELLGTYPKLPIAVASLGIVIIFSTFFLWSLYYYIVKNYMRDEYIYKDVRKNLYLAFFGGPIIYGFAVLMAWVNIYISFVIYSIIPLLFILPLDKPKKMFLD